MTTTPDAPVRSRGGCQCPARCRHQALAEPAGATPRAAWLVAVLVLLAGLPFAWIRGQSHFNSEAVFQVAPTYMKNLDADKELELQSNSQYREFVNHLSNTVVRQDVLERAVTD